MVQISIVLIFNKKQLLRLAKHLASVLGILDRKFDKLGGKEGTGFSIMFYAIESAIEDYRCNNKCLVCSFRCFFAGSKYVSCTGQCWTAM